MKFTCTKCGTESTIPNEPEHGEVYRCPKCGESTTFYNVGEASANTEEHPTKDGQNETQSVKKRWSKRDSIGCLYWGLTTIVFLVIASLIRIFLSTSPIVTGLVILVYLVITMKIIKYSKRDKSK